MKDKREAARRRKSQPTRRSLAARAMTQQIFDEDPEETEESEETEEPDKSNPSRICVLSEFHIKIYVLNHMIIQM